MVDTVDLTGAGSTTTIGGVIFQDSANVGSGTGNYATFLAVGDNDGNEAGFNSDDTSPIEPSNPNQDLAKSETLLLGSIPIVLINGVAYYEFRVDLNEPNNATTGQISLDTFRIYTSTSNQISTLGQLVDTNNTDIVYDMDSAYGSNVSVLLSEVSTGSGTDDYSVLIPVSLFGNADPATTYLYLYVEMGFYGGEFVGDSGFEEWNTQQAGTLTGFKFSDVDSDGVWDAGEAGVGGVTVFIDADKDGVLDGDANGNGVQDNGEVITERYTVTAGDGSYTFFGVPLGTWQIDEVVPAGSTQTTGDFETVTISTQNQVVAVAPIGNHYPVPAIDIQKTFVNVTDGPDGGPASTTVINGAGDVANYTIAVDNTGETGLVNVVVTDPLATTLTEQLSGGFNVGDLDQDDVLDTTETWYWTATQTAVQGDLDTNGGGDGDIDNVAYVTADQEGAPLNHVSDNDDAAAPVVPSAALALVKVFTGYTGGDGDNLGDTVGDIANYSLTVTNTGNVTLTNVVITDPLTGLNHPVGTLAPGQSATVSAQYIVTQADLDGGGNAGSDHDIDNTATATSDQTGQAQASAVAPLVYAPALAIDKVVVDVGGDGAGGVADTAGEVITYRVSVSNVGNVTLTNVTVVDPLTGLNIVVPSLAVGATWTSDPLYYAVTQADIDTNGGGDGDIDNTATADSNETGPSSDSEDVPVDQNPALAINKVVIDVDGAGPGGTADAAGDVITYRVSVTNTGNQTLTGVTAVDPLTGLNVLVGTLAVGATWTSDPLTYTVTQADIDTNGGGDGDIDNTATADSNETPSASDSEDVPVDQNPSLAIDKVVIDVDGDGPNGTADAAGDVITYQVTVTNTGNQTLTGVTVVDPLTGTNILVGTLAVGQIWTSPSLLYTVTQADIDNNGGGDGDIDNTATADSNETGSSSDSEDVPVDQNPALAISKLVIDVDGAGPDGVADAAGDVITYAVAVANIGNQTLTGVTVVDPLTGLNLLIGTLEVGETWFSDPLTYTVTQADIDTNGGGDGDIDNTATADSNETGPEDDSKEVPVDQNPSLAINKIVVDVDGDGPDGTADAAGDVITYRVSVENTGNQTLTGVTVVDPLTGLNVLVGNLAVGATWTSADLYYVVQQSDIDSNGGGDGDIDNTATADSNETPSASDSEDVPVDQNPSLAIDKVVIDVGGGGADAVADTAGEVITYRVSVQNTGNQTLTNVTVADPLTGLNIVVPSLAVGATWTSDPLFYTVQQSDIDSNGGGDGDIDNTATADSDQTGPSSDSEDVPVDQNPSLAIDKVVIDVDGAGPDGTANAAGDVITYQVTVTNTGNQTLTGVTVVDPLTGLNVLVGNLAVGGFWTSAPLYYAVTQADINTNGGGDGDIDNTATADSNETPSASDSEDVPVDQIPVLVIDKTGDTDLGDDCIDVVGETITWTINVTRAGNVDLDNVVVTDNRFGGGTTALTLAGGDDGDGVLEAGETWTYSFTEVVTQAMINANAAIVNTAYANGDAVNSSEAAAQVSDGATLEICQDPVMYITKSGTTDQGDNCIDVVGESLVWRIEVSRGGNVDIDGVTVTDDRGTPVYVSGDDGDNVLEAGETWVYELEETVTQAMINANVAIVNTAYANGEAVNSAEAAAQVSDDASVEVCQDPALTIVKTGDTDQGDDCIDVIGETITWTINVTRAGNVDLDNVVVTDNRFGGGTTALTLAGGDDGDGVLEAGETWTYSFTEVVTSDMIDDNDAIVNTAYANGDAVNSSEAAAQVSDGATLEICQDPAINLEKYVLTDQSGGYLDADDPDGPIASTSSNVSFRITLSNTGNVTLGAITLSDSIVHTVVGVETVQALNYSDPALNAWVDLDGDTIKDTGEEWATLDANNDGTLDTVTLAAGGSLNIYYSLTSELGQHENTASVTATAVNGVETATDTDDANYYVLPSEDCVGVGTPGFWSNNGAVFWDGIQNNETKAGQPGFADGELLYNVYLADTNGDGTINSSDTASKGLLIGDYNANGITDAGEDTLFISYDNARTLINASAKQQQDGKYMLGRDVVATWLNYLANGGSDGDDSCIDRPGSADDGSNPQFFIDAAIDWLQTFAGASGNGAATLADNTTGETSDSFWLGAAAVKTSSSYWQTAVADVSTVSAASMHSALDAYNNTGAINGVEFCCDRDNADAIFAIQQIV